MNPNFSKKIILLALVVQWLNINVSGIYLFIIYLKTPSISQPAVSNVKLINK
jgi:hypothetical protein